MRRCCQQRGRPARRAIAAGAVERPYRHAELIGIGADVGQRDQPVKAIERRVLDALGGNRGSELLKAHGEVQALFDRDACFARLGHSSSRRKTNTLASVTRLRRLARATAQSM